MSEAYTLLELKLDEAFDENMECIVQNLQQLRSARSEGSAEAALESFYIALSEEDSRLSQYGREELKSILVEDEFALKTILEAMKRRYSNAKFYRRALSCITYLIRDSEEHASEFVELGGMEFTIEVMEAFDRNAVIQWYGFDLLGKLVSSSEGYDNLVVDNIVSSVVGTMLEMYQSSLSIYSRACKELESILKEKPNIRAAIAKHAASVSRNIVKQCSKSVKPIERGDFLSNNFGQLSVCHDILDIALAG